MTGANAIRAVIHRSWQLHSGNSKKIFKLMSAAAVTRLAQLALVAILARQLGTTEFGLFVFTTGTAMLAGMVGGMGWPQAFNRYFAIYRENRQFALLNGLMQTSMRMTLAGVFVAAAVLAGYSLFEATLSQGLLMGAILGFPYAIMMLRRQQLAGTGQAPVALLLDEGFASLTLLLAVLLFHLELTTMLAIYFLAMVVGNGVARVLIKRRLPSELVSYGASFEKGPWAKSGLSLLVAQSARIALSRFDVLLIPTLANLTEAGLYGAVFRATHIITFPQFVLQTVTWPMFAQAFAQNNQAKVRRILAATLGFALLTSLPFVIIIALFPAQIMTLLFGAEYARGAEALIYVALGQFALGLSFPFAGVLAMGGREAGFGALNVTVLLVSVGLAFLLVPSRGAVGGGIVLLAATTLLLSGQLVQSLRPLGLTRSR